MYISTNKFQTQLTDELLASLNPEVKDDLLDMITNVEYVKRLISPDRRYAKDMPRSKNSKIIVDLCNPHILEHMEYFTQSADHFRKFGCYTKLMPNPNPQSEFGQWLKRELRRCWNGMVRESDGEWITGDMYFYLNYFPIIQTKIIEGTKIGDRITDFPEVWEGVYLRFHYWNQARYGGLYDDFMGAKHCVEIAARGKSHPYSQDVLTPDGWTKWSEINIGSILYGDDGLETKVIDIPFNDNIDVYKITLRDGREVFSSKNHLWNVYKHGLKHDNILTLSLGNILLDYKRKRKITERNPNGFEYVYSIPTHNLIEFKSQDVYVDPYTMGLLLGNGTFRHPEYKNTVAFTSHKDDMDTYKKYIPYEVRDSKTAFAYSMIIPEISKYLDEVGLFMKKSEDKFIPDEYKFNSKEVRLNILKGLMDTDGSLSDGKPTYSSVSERLIKDLAFIVRSLGYNCNYTKQKAGYKKNGIYIECQPCYCMWIYTNDEIFNLPRKINLLKEYTSKYSKSKKDKTRIVNIEFSHNEISKCVTVDNNSNCYLVGDFVTTHNSKSYSFGSKLCKNFILGESELTSKTGKVKSLIAAYSKEYLIKDGTINKFIDGITHCAKTTQFPSKKIKASLSDLTWKAGYLDAVDGLEMGTLNEVLGVAVKDDSDKLRGKRSSWMGYEEFAVFPQFLNTWQTSLPNVQEGTIVFGQASACGCICKDSVIYDRFGREYLIQDVSVGSGILGFKDNTANIEPITYIQDYTEKECVRIEHSYGEIKCSIDHPILCKVPIRSRKTNIRGYENKFVNAIDIKKSYYLAEIDKIDVWGNELLFDSYLVGALIGDGSYGFDKTPVISNCDESLLNYIENNYTTKLEKTYITKDNRIYKELRILNLCKSLRNIGIYGQTKSNKRLPTNYLSLNKQESSELIAGLYDTDGYIGKNSITMSQVSFEIQDQVVRLLRKFGIIGHINKIKSSKYSTYRDRNSDTFIYVLEIKDVRSLNNFAINIPLKIEYKIDNLKKLILESQPEENIRWRTINKITKIGINQVYNLTANDSNTYIANNIITHNTGGSEGCLTENNKVFNGSGDLVSIKDININSGIIGHNIIDGVCSIEEIDHVNNPTYKNCVKITTNSYRTLECSIDHPILSSNKSDYNKCRVFEWIKSGDLIVGDKVAISKEINIFSNKNIFDPRLLGLLIGDGSYISSPRITSCDKEIQDYIIDNYNANIYGESILTKDGKSLVTIGIKKIKDELRNVGIYGQSKNNKRLPGDIFLSSKNDVAELIGGLFDTDGSVNIYRNCKGNRLDSTTLNLSSSSIELLKEVQLLLMKLGVYANILFHNPSKNVNKKIKDKDGYYSLEISSRDSIIKFHDNVSFLIKYKQELLNEAYIIALSKNRWKKDRGYEYETIKSIEYIGSKLVYNLSAKNTHTYLGNGIITHNSDFMGALEMLLYPDGYNVYSLPNFWDKGAMGQKRTIFFFPGYINSKGFYNKDGVSDVVGSLISEIEHRVNLKYNSSDPLQLTRRKAETAFTIQDAIMRRDGSMYPSDKLNDVINEINMNPKYTDDMWIGRLKMGSDGLVEYKLDNDLKYITEFPHKDNKLEGAICIKHMPVKDSSGRIPWGRYISGADVYDDDSSDTLSLFSMFILDLWTDELVFEYTGRPMFADDAYENCRLALLMYNAECNYENNKKGLFGYFSKMNSLYLLSDTLDFLKDKEMVKGGMYGNKAKGSGNYGTVAPYGRRCYRDYLLKPDKTIVMEEVDGKFEEKVITTLGLNKIWSKGLLQETASWNADGNFDRHDAMIMLMLLREDKLRLLGSMSAKDAINNRDTEYLGKDKFFEKNYKRGMVKDLKIFEI